MHAEQSLKIETYVDRQVYLVIRKAFFVFCFNCKMFSNVFKPRKFRSSEDENYTIKTILSFLRDRNYVKTNNYKPAQEDFS